MVVFVVKATIVTSLFAKHQRHLVVAYQFVTQAEITRTMLGATEREGKVVAQEVAHPPRVGI